MGKIQTESAAKSGFDRWNEALSLTECAGERERRKLSFRGLPENTTPETDSQRYLWSEARSM